MNLGRRRPPAFLVITVGIVLGILLIVVISAPRVEEFKPSTAGDAISSLTRVSLRFSQPMDRLSVESRVQIDPTVSGKYFWEGQTLIFEPDEPWPAGGEVNVTLSGGAQGLNRLPMIGQRVWVFNVGPPSLVYLWPGEGKSNLYRLSVDPDSEATQLTESESGIMDYSISLDGSLIAYVTELPDGTTELHNLDLISKQDQLLLACEIEHPCGAPSISPDGTWLAFERSDYEMGAAGRLVTTGRSVWLMSLAEQVEPYAVSPEDHNAVSPEWSPTGWLVYYDDRLKALALLNPLDHGDSVPFNYIPTGLGLLGSWSPDGTRLVYPDIIFPDEGSSGGIPSGEGSPLYYSHIYMVDVTNGRTTDISPDGDWMVEDASPSLSPDGAWVAFTRKFLDPEHWSLGRQVWLMNSERTEVMPLTDEPGANFSSLAWSPDSERLTFMRKPIADLAQPAEIWWVDVISGQATLVVQDGYLPGWLP